MLKFFDTHKWDPVQLLHGHVVLYQDASNSGDAYLIHVVACLQVVVAVAGGDGLYCLL